MKRKPVEVTWEQLLAAIEDQRPEMLRVGDAQPVNPREQLVVEAICRRAFACRRAFCEVDLNVCVASPDQQGPDGVYIAYCPPGNAVEFMGPAACAAAHAYCVGIDFGGDT